MKITYLCLKNFSAIETGMHKKKLEINFDKCKNNIVLLVGINGSGKTALLSTLHPFAYPGSMDIRANATMIIKDCDGYKEIHYSHNGSKYEIIHHYKNSKRGLTVKSFIKKNGTEINPNGNVTSFNDIVYNELGIQSDFLKVLRLGSNVTNLIEMKASERKSFTSNLFSELDMWLELYKKVNEDNRMLKGLLVAVANKLQRLNIDDKDELKEHIKKLESEIVNINTNINILNVKLGSIQGIIQTKIPQGVTVLNEDICNDKNKLDNLGSELNCIIHDMKAMNIIITGDISDDINRLTEKLNQFNISKGKIESSDINLNNRLNELMNELDSVNNQINKTKSDAEMNALIELSDIIKDNIKKYPESIKTFKPLLSKSELLLAINILNEIERIVQLSYEFGDDAVQKAIDLIQDDINIDKFIGDKVAKIDKKIAEIKAMSKTNTGDALIILYRPPSCNDDKCPYLNLYNRFFGKEKSDKESIPALEHKRDYWINVSSAVHNMKNIQSIVSTYADMGNTLKNMKINYFDIDVIYDHIYDNEPIFDESRLTREISNVEDYECYMSDVNKLKDIELEISDMSTDDVLLKSLEIRKNELSIKINNTNNDIKKNIIALNKVNKSIASYEKMLASYNEYKRLDDRYNKLDAEIVELTYSVNDKQNVLESVSQYISDTAIINDQLNNYNERLNTLNKEIFDARYRLKTYNTLMKERKILNEQFEEVAIINESLSSNKGVPLLFIQLYLQSTTMFVNNILSSVYDNFEIAGFNITESEFTIPYVKNGVMIDDVTSASQGERSFLSLALSFALINKSIKDYNIILLDEIDATLDTRNRAMFLNILMQMLDLIQSEQVFMITHNNMFDSYPVDVIMTSDINLDNYKNANIIFKAN